MPVPCRYLLISSSAKTPLRNSDSEIRCSRCLLSFVVCAAALTGQDENTCSGILRKCDRSHSQTDQLQHCSAGALRRCAPSPSHNRPFQVQLVLKSFGGAELQTQTTVQCVDRCNAHRSKASANSGPYYNPENIDLKPLTLPIMCLEGH